MRACLIVGRITSADDLTHGCVIVDGDQVLRNFGSPSDTRWIRKLDTQHVALCKFTPATVRDGADFTYCSSMPAAIADSSQALLCTWSVCHVMLRATMLIAAS